MNHKSLYAFHGNPSISCWDFTVWTKEAASNDCLFDPHCHSLNHIKWWKYNRWNNEHWDVENQRISRCKLKAVKCRSYSVVQNRAEDALLLYCHKQSTNHQQLNLCQFWKCVLSPRKLYGDRPLQNRHFILTALLADLSQTGWVEPLDWHVQHNADLHHSKQLSFTLSGTITELHTCLSAKFCCMHPIQTRQAWRDGKPLE